ncbi:hypothetical protein NGM67_09815 [Photobacterium damselae]|uniref:hypothetical protein n=1 Tax=Photobacterium damselae TaxID=38293 RepID=UPI002090AC27|nr:hypothetical protein [Photobacterium damselae]USR78050.1 hypothetical protein NGM67_09815 [Photobacterium damselae]
MLIKSKLSKYIELFKRNISNYLAPHVTIKTVVHPVSGNGAVFEFFLNQENNSEIIWSSVRPTIGKVLTEIPQNMIGGNIENVNFGGTNLYLEGNRIVVIKGEDSTTEWSGATVINDVQRVVSSSQGGRS